MMFATISWARVFSAAGKLTLDDICRPAKPTAPLVASTARFQRSTLLGWRRSAHRSEEGERLPWNAGRQYRSP